MATSKHKAALQRLSRLRQASRLAFIGAFATTLVSYIAKTTNTWIWPGGLVAAILIWILTVIIVEHLALRTLCPNCDKLFFQRTGEIGGSWKTQEYCVACRFNLYRGGNILRES